MWKFKFGNFYFIDLNKEANIIKLKVSINNYIRALKISENGDYLISAGKKVISVIDISKKAIIFKVEYNINCEFDNIFQRKYGNILITEYGKLYKIKEFQFDNKLLKLNFLSEKEKDFTNYISSIDEFDEGSIISGGYDHKVIRYSFN